MSQSRGGGGDDPYCGSNFEFSCRNISIFEIHFVFFNFTHFTDAPLGTTFYRVKDTSFTFDAFIMDGVRDFDRSEPALWCSALT